jgi:hypothetical protein
MPALRFHANHAKKIASLLFVQKIQSNPAFSDSKQAERPLLFRLFLPCYSACYPPVILLLFTCFPHVHTVSVIPEDFARAASFLDS